MLVIPNHSSLPMMYSYKINTLNDGPSPPLTQEGFCGIAVVFEPVVALHVGTFLHG